MTGKIKKDLLIIGPSPLRETITHPGGQLTAITSLIDYIDNNDFSYDILDTYRSSFPMPSSRDKLSDSWGKHWELLKLLKGCDYSGAVVFSGYGLGFWEKMWFSMLIESRGIKTLLFIPSGHFMNAVIEADYRVPLKRFLMNRLSFIGHQGGRWGKFYADLGIEKGKLVKICNWIETNEYSRTFENDRVTFLYVGWIVEKKGVVELVEAIIENRALDGFDFVFVGEGTLFETLKDRVDESSAANIKFTGWLDRAGVNEYYQRADALVFPSHAEGFPNAVLEALSYKLPIIATDVGGTSESVINNENGFLVRPGDRQALLRSIVKLGASREMRERFSNKSAEIVAQNHNLDRNCNKIFDLFS